MPFYTVGQRKEGRRWGAPLCRGSDRARNAVVVGKRSEAYSMGCVVEGLNVIADNRLRDSVRGICMVRYRGKEVGATMEPLSYRQEEPDSAVIRFDTPEFAVTPGQSAVLYQDDLVYGGGHRQEAGKEVDCPAPSTPTSSIRGLPYTWPILLSQAHPRRRTSLKITSPVGAPGCRLVERWLWICRSPRQSR